VRSRLRRGLELLRGHVTELASSPAVLAKVMASVDGWSARLDAEPDTDA
jgi:hypothetical protein